MKLLLTSGGLTNKSIQRAFLKLAGKPASKIKVAFIPTASNVEIGDKWWIIKDLNILSYMKVAQIDIVDISALSKKMMLKRLSIADVIFVEGGNTFYLMRWIKKSGLIDLLPKLLKTRVWVGTSAGSIVAGHKLSSFDNLFDENGKPYSTNDGLNYLDFSVKTHYLNPNLASKKRIMKMANNLGTPIYAIDDNSAIAVDGKKIEVITEGKWKKFDSSQGDHYA